MRSLEFAGINSFVVGMAQILLEEGVSRTTRGEKCIELPYPVIIKITNPRSKWITIPERRWNPFLAYAESLWIASGRNDLNPVKYYLKRLESFSDDGEYLRGGYGPRYRCYNGESRDYEINTHFSNLPLKNSIDQFRFIEDCFKRDIFTRQAIISVGDPMKDCYGENEMIKVSKDFPCTRQLHFMTDPINNHLNLTVYMRSNDFFWGATGVNMFNNMLIQEYFSSILKLNIGYYYHIVSNFHYYPDRHLELLKKLSEIKETNDEEYIYKPNINNLMSFDNYIYQLSLWENDLREGRTNQLIYLNDEFFDDWARVIFYKVTGTHVKASNPILDGILQGCHTSSNL